MAEGIGLYRRDRRNLRLHAGCKVQKRFGRLLRQVIRQVEERVLGRRPHVAQPFGRNSVAQQVLVRDAVEEARPGRSR
jgi:hypothetical protein